MAQRLDDFYSKLKSSNPLVKNYYDFQRLHKVRLLVEQEIKKRCFFFELAGYNSQNLSDNRKNITTICGFLQ